MLRSRANEIPALVRQLGSRRESRVDAARARLSIIGARAVEHLIEALEGTNNRVRVHVMPLLAVIRDPRGREPLIAMLLDRQARLREIAAMCLARFPSPDSVAALNRALSRDTRDEVRVAAVRSLVEQYAAGEEQAICMALDVLVHAGHPASIRLAAFSLLRALRASQRRSILERLKRDPDASVRRRAEEFASGAHDSGAVDDETLRTLLDDLASEDYASWNEAVRRLAACGVAAIQPLVAEMLDRAHDPEYCTRAGMALKAMGRRRGHALAGALDTVEEPLPLQVLVEVVGALGDKSLIYRLKEVIERVAALPRAVEGNGFDPTRRVRAKAHLELARVGSRVAIRDLREALGDPGHRLELEMLAAVEMIGKREELSVLLKAYGTEDAFVRRKIRDVIRSIMKRERIRRNDRMFQTLGADQQRALKAILPRTPERGRRTGSRARPRA